MGPLTCYDGKTECGPGVQVTFTSSAADDYAKAKYTGTVLSYGAGDIIGSLYGGGSSTWIVVPGGTASIEYGNTNASCGYLGSASISAQGNTATLSQPYRCGNGTAQCGGLGSSPCPPGPYELTVVTLQITVQNQ
jgi:hypothetical protein